MENKSASNPSAFSGESLDWAPDALNTTTSGANTVNSKPDQTTEAKDYGIPQENTIPTALGEATTNQEKPSKSKWFFAIVIILIILTYSGVAGYYFYNQNKPETAVANPIVTLTPIPTQVISPEPTVTLIQNNQIDTFLSALAIFNYKVSTSGNIGFNEQGTGSSPTSSFNLDNGTIYLQNGSVVRVDKTELGKSEVGFIKGDEIYMLNPSAKTYSVFSSTDEMGEFYATVIKSSFPLNRLAEDTVNGTVTWQEAGSNEYEAGWHWESPLDTTTHPVKVKIVVNTDTDLIETFSLKFETDDSWQDVTFQYEKIESIEDLLQVPPEYSIESP